VEPIDRHLIESGASRLRLLIAEVTRMSVAGLVGITDEELLVRAMRDAQSLLAEHIERGPFDAEQAITELLEVIDRQDIVAATNRLCDQFGLRPSRSR
jgi:hypothetical protein